MSYGDQDYRQAWDQLSKSIKFGVDIGAPEGDHSVEMLWGVYDYSEREKHIAPVGEAHTFTRNCGCEQRIEIGDGYVLVIHESLEAMSVYSTEEVQQGTIYRLAYSVEEINAFKWARMDAAELIFRLALRQHENVDSSFLGRVHKRLLHAVMYGPYDQ